jgi:hypothetical protein
MLAALAMFALGGEVTSAPMKAAIGVLPAPFGAVVGGLVVTSAPSDIGVGVLVGEGATSRANASLPAGGT